MKISLDQIKTTAIVSINSIDYVQCVYKSLLEGECIVPLREVDDKYRLEATNTSKVITPESTKGWLDLTDYNYEQMDLNKIAQISFTSGTEGEPKGVLLSHQALYDVVNRLYEFSKVDSTIREYIGVPVYHSFGYARCRLIAKVSGLGYIPENGFDPKELSKMLKDLSINSLSAVPSMLRVLLSVKEIFGSEALNLKWIEIGSQPMSAVEKQELKDLFPNANIIQHYGLTEASRATILEVDKVKKEHLDSVGKAVGTTSVSISPTGRILIKGHHIADGYLKDGTIIPAVNEEGWLVTSDLGEINDGYLYYQGRADNLINCGGQKVSCEYLEEKIEQSLKLFNGFAISKIPHPIYGDGILLSVESNTQNRVDEIIKIVKDHLSEIGISSTAVLRSYVCEKIPLTDTGKTQYNRLSEIYLQNSTNVNESINTNFTNSKEELIYRLYVKFFNNIDRDTTTFKSMGGDSLAAVAISVDLERILGFIPNTWRELTISELVNESANITEKKFNQSNQNIINSSNLGSSNMNPSDLSFWQLVKEDYLTHDRSFFSQGFWAVYNNRFGNMRMGFRYKLARFPLTIIYRIQTKLVQWLCGIKLDYTVKIGRRVKLEHFGGMILGAKEIADDVTIRQNTTFGIKDLSNLLGKPTIEKGVNIGAGAVIVGDITIGRYSVIGPNAVVDTDIPPFSVVQTSNNTIIQN